MAGKPTNFDVSGGAKGTDAKYDDMLELSKLTDDVGHEGLATALAGHKYLVEPDVVASALLDPGGVASFESAMATALDGPSGLTMAAGEITIRATAIVAAQKAYELTDDLNAKLFDTSRWLAGLALGSSPLGLLAVAGLGGEAAAEVYTKYDGDWQKWLVDHPGVIDEVIATSPGVLSALGLPSTIDSTLDVLAATYPDSKGKTVPVSTGEHETPPGGLGDIVDGLGRRNLDKDSNIDVRVIRDANKHITGYVVDVPGTKDWNLPGTDKSANDLGVNVDAMAGNDTVLQQGIADALREAGAGGPPHAPIMLAGHSQGGIVAARAVGDLKADGYNVTHVVTAGSPIGRIDVPDDVQVLSLENKNDIVPHLDAADNPDSANRTNVEFENNTGKIDGNHSLGDPVMKDGDPVLDEHGRPKMTSGNYSAAAHDLDTSTDPSVAAYRDGMDAFTGGDPRYSTLDRYRVARVDVHDDMAKNEKVAQQ